VHGRLPDDVRDCFVFHDTICSQLGEQLILHTGVEIAGGCSVGNARCEYRRCDCVAIQG
jgi:hypothetical protein